MYAIVVFPYNEKVDEEFIVRFFEPCPKVGAIGRFIGGTLVVFKAPLDELEQELQIFLEPGGMFEASWGEIVKHLDPPEWEAALEARLSRNCEARENPPCGSNCAHCPQYRRHCRGCPVTPLYLGDSFPLGG